ncbi:hypothetical protein [Ekhidna sp.]|uniref:hypothetical protein n=1 Tax=Ekhidna sp. TaxID=2608089 RepID=UPI003BAD425E
MKRKKVTIFLYNRLFDPLIQSNFWLYIKDYLNDTERSVDFYLITYENPLFPLTDEQQTLVNEWVAEGLKWKRLKWNPGTGIVAKALDIIQGFFALTTLRFQGYKYALSLGSVAGTFLYLYSLLLRNKFFLYQFEPHSEYAIDNGMWAKESLQYKFSHYLERKAAARASVIASGTRFMEERVRDVWKFDTPFFKIPTVANDQKFIFSALDRKKVRQELGITNDTHLLFYPGKFGDLYYREEAAFMFKWLKEEIPNLHFLIVTPHEDEEVIALFDNANVSNEQYTIAHSDYKDIHRYFSSADFAVISVPPGPSKKFISNIKVGEYLCAGLPFLITEGISEDYLYALEKNVGVVVKDFEEPYIKKAAKEIQFFLDKDKNELRKHCREVGLEYRGFKKLNLIFRDAIQELVK